VTYQVLLVGDVN